MLIKIIIKLELTSGRQQCETKGKTIHFDPQSYIRSKRKVELILESRNCIGLIL